jgi:hypothetical protein
MRVALYAWLDLHVDAVLGRDKRAFAITVTAWANVLANNFEICALDITGAQLKELQV